MGIEKMREFRLGSSLAFSWIDQKGVDERFARADDWKER
jgi:hypothetical protein